MISLEEKRAAYEEARQLLLLEKKWQSLMPGERKPDFKRAAKAVIRRALGKQVVPREPDLDLHDGLMHEHAPREARLIERTLRNGIVHPDVLHSFRHGEVPVPLQVPIGALTGGRQHVPLGELKRAGDTYIGDMAPMVHAVQFNEDLEFRQARRPRAHALHDPRSSTDRCADAGQSSAHLVFLLRKTTV